MTGQEWRETAQDRVQNGQGIPTPRRTGKSRSADTTPTRHGCRCGRRWTGTLICHCGGCHQTFSAIASFDAHQRGGACHNPAEVLKRDHVSPMFTSSDNDLGRVWSMATGRPQPLHWSTA